MHSSRARRLAIWEDTKVRGSRAMMPGQTDSSPTISTAASYMFPGDPHHYQEPDTREPPARRVRDGGWTKERHTLTYIEPNRPSGWSPQQDGWTHNCETPLWLKLQ